MKNMTAWAGTQYLLQVSPRTYASSYHPDYYLADYYYGQVAGNKNSRGGKVLFAIEPRYGRLYVPWVDEVRNLASVSRLGAEVYVRSESRTVLADIRERLAAVGYTEKRRMIPPFISGLRQAIMAGRVKEHLMSATVLCLYLGFAVAMYYHHRRYRKQMKVARIFGAGLFSMSRYRVWPFVVKVCLLLVLFGAMMHLWEGKWFISGLPEIYRVWILVLHGTVSVLLYQTGKSSLMNIIGLLDDRYEGQYLVDGRDVGQLSGSKKARLRNELFGFVFQDYLLIETDTVYENVRIPLLYSRYPAGLHRQMIEEALKLVELGDVAEKRVTALSGGQRQRVAIARALVHKPAFILADEPTGSLDMALSRRIMELLKRYLDEDHALIMVTHNEALAKRYFKRCIRLCDGAVVSDSGQ